MVFINDLKFACESCIKGHRSSSCKHSDRPLFEIKKKGRPVSQCEKCRKLRQSKRVHSKCLCNSTECLDPESSSARLSSFPRKKTGRFVPTTPSLPNGISDILSSYGSGTVSSSSKQRLDSLLNPCTCKSIQKCRCRTELHAPRDGLAALANAAALCLDGQQSLGNPSWNVATSMTTLTPRNPSMPKPKPQSSRPFTPPNSVHKRYKHSPANHQPPNFVLGPSLPPIHLSSPSSSASSRQVPDFPIIPPISILTSLAGSGCTCGLHCACPGCVEHRGEEHASKIRADCADGCGTCVDWQAGIGLPATTQLTGGSSKSIVNQFLERAAALPLPPRNRNRYTGFKIDPMNVQVYPANLFSPNPPPPGNSSPAAKQSEGTFDVEGREAAFGLVKVPKLECCGGRCGCPKDGCGCGKSCDGRCQEHGLRTSNMLAPLEAIAPSTHEQSMSSSSTIPVRSCCAKRYAKVS